jgi:GNAT superfamily N-acetyltransferase
MVVVRETVAGDWQALRDIRLEALRTAPTAFGSTYEQEALRGEEHWHARIACGGTFLAYLPENEASDPAGLIGGYPEDPHTVELVSMFVRSNARGRGVGEALVATVVDWARDRNATAVRLWVTETNNHAIALYGRCGFALTGERQPVPSAPSLDEVAMTRTLPLPRAAAPAAARRTAPAPTPRPR